MINEKIISSNSPELVFSPMSDEDWFDSVLSGDYINELYGLIVKIGVCINSQQSLAKIPLDNFHQRYIKYKQCSQHELKEMISECSQAIQNRIDQCNSSAQKIDNFLAKTSIDDIVKPEKIQLLLVLINEMIDALYLNIDQEVKQSVLDAIDTLVAKHLVIEIGKDQPTKDILKRFNFGNDKIDMYFNTLFTNSVVSPAQLIKLKIVKNTKDAQILLAILKSKRLIDKDNIPAYSVFKKSEDNVVLGLNQEKTKSLLRLLRGIYSRAQNSIIDLIKEQELRSAQKFRSNWDIRETWRNDFPVYQLSSTDAEKMIESMFKSYEEQSGMNKYRFSQLMISMFEPFYDKLIESKYPRTDLINKFMDLAIDVPATARKNAIQESMISGEWQDSDGHVKNYSERFSAVRQRFSGVLPVIISKFIKSGHHKKHPLVLNRMLSMYKSTLVDWFTEICEDGLSDLDIIAESLVSINHPQLREFLDLAIHFTKDPEDTFQDKATKAIGYLAKPLMDNNELSKTRELVEYLIRRSKNPSVVRMEAARLALFDVYPLLVNKPEFKDLTSTINKIFTTCWRSLSSESRDIRSKRSLYRKHVNQMIINTYKQSPEDAEQLLNFYPLIPFKAWSDIKSWLLLMEDFGQINATIQNRLAKQFVVTFFKENQNKKLTMNWSPMFSYWRNEAQPQLKKLDPFLRRLIFSMTPDPDFSDRLLSNKWRHLVEKMNDVHRNPITRDLMFKSHGLPGPDILFQVDAFLQFLKHGDTNEISRLFDKAELNLVDKKEVLLPLVSDLKDTILKFYQPNLKKIIQIASSTKQLGNKDKTISTLKIAQDIGFDNLDLPQLHGVVKALYEFREARLSLPQNKTNIEFDLGVENILFSVLDRITAIIPLNTLNTEQKNSLLKSIASHLNLWSLEPNLIVSGSIREQLKYLEAHAKPDVSSKELVKQWDEIFDSSVNTLTTIWFNALSSIKERSSRANISSLPKEVFTLLDKSTIEQLIDISNQERDSESTGQKMLKIKGDAGILASIHIRESIFARIQRIAELLAR